MRMAALTKNAKFNDIAESQKLYFNDSLMLFHHRLFYGIAQVKNADRDYVALL